MFNNNFDVTSLGGLIILAFFFVVSVAASCAIGMLLSMGACALWEKIKKMLELREGYGEITYIYDPIKNDTYAQVPSTLMLSDGTMLKVVPYCLSVTDEYGNSQMYEFEPELLKYLYVGKKIAFFWFEGIRTLKIHSIKEPKTSCLDEFTPKLLPQQATV